LSVFDLGGVVLSFSDDEGVERISETLIDDDRLDYYRK
jgi:hypothetical protein